MIISKKWRTLVSLANVTGFGMLTMPAFNLLNDVDIAATEKRITEYTRQNEAVITANKQKAGIEAMGQAERDEFEKRAREERMRMVEEAERRERAESDRVKADIVAALVSRAECALGKRCYAADMCRLQDRCKKRMSCGGHTKQPRQHARSTSRPIYPKHLLSLNPSPRYSTHHYRHRTQDPSSLCRSMTRTMPPGRRGTLSGADMSTGGAV